MDTLPLLYDDHFHAIRAAIEGSGKRYKDVAISLWPSMKPDSAYARLKNCCHPEGDQKLDLSEIVTLCKVTGCADPLYFLAIELHHERPKAIALETEAKQLVDSLAAHLADIKRATDKLEHLTRTNPAILKSVA